MSRRIEIQLTSRKSDETWTWRAAGAREPKGVLVATLLPEGVAEGDVLRAEVETTIDGIEVLSVTAGTAVAVKPAKVEVIEVVGSGRNEVGVSWSLAPKSKGRGRGDRGDRGDRGERGGGDRGGRSGPGAPGGRPRSEGGRDSGRGGRPGDRRSEGGRDGARGGRPQGPPQSTEHRNAMLAALSPEQLPVAEQLLRGGIPAVRQAIDEQNSQARTNGQPQIAPEGVLTLAEGLLPLTTLAAWKDRAAGVISGGKEIRLRDLRTVVTASRSVSLDEGGKAMAKTLRETLTQRTQALNDEWIGRMTTALDEDRVADALRLSARAPEPAARVTAEVATRLSEAAGAGLTAETDPRSWMILLDAVCESPVRRTVKPLGIPSEADTEAAARNAAGLVPALAKLLGLRIPPPPPRRSVVHHRRDPISQNDEG